MLYSSFSWAMLVLAIETRVRRIHNAGCCWNDWHKKNEFQSSDFILGLNINRRGSGGKSGGQRERCHTHILEFRSDEKLEHMSVSKRPTDIGNPWKNETLQIEMRK